MCLTPLILRNPYSQKSRVFSSDPSQSWSNEQFAKTHYKDYIHKYMYVPCGKCPACVANKESAIIQRVEMHCQFHHAFMVTLTYNQEMLPHLITSTGRDIVYASYKDVQDMFRRIRTQNLFERPFSYMVVSELGSKKGRPHFHMIFFCRKYDTDNYNTIKSLENQLWHLFFEQWKRRVGGSDKFPVFAPLYTYKVKYKNGKRISNFDCHYIDDNTAKNNGKSDVVFYVLKYLYKRSDREIWLRGRLFDELTYDEFCDTWKLVRTSWRASKGIGLPVINDKSDDFDLTYREFVDNKIKSFIKLSRLDQSCKYPLFYSSYGKTYPLSKIYKNIYMSLDDVSVFAIRNGFDDPLNAFSLRTDGIAERMRLEKSLRTFRKMSVMPFDEDFYECACDDEQHVIQLTKFEESLEVSDIQILLTFESEKLDNPICNLNSSTSVYDAYKSWNAVRRFNKWREWYISINKWLDRPIIRLDDSDDLPF